MSTGNASRPAQSAMCCNGVNSKPCLCLLPAFPLQKAISPSSSCIARWHVSTFSFKPNNFSKWWIVCQIMINWVYRYVCIYICMYVCMYVCMYICSSSSRLSCFIKINGWGRLAAKRLLLCIHVCMFVCTYACMYVRKCVYMQVCLCVYMYNYTCECMYMHGMCACVRLFSCKCVCELTHILPCHGSCKYSLDHGTTL